MTDTVVPVNGYSVLPTAIGMISYSYFVPRKASSGFPVPGSLCSYGPVANRSTAKCTVGDRKVRLGLWCGRRVRLVRGTASLGNPAVKNLAS